MPVIWLDVLDLPLMVYLDVSYAVEGTSQTAQRARVCLCRRRPRARRPWPARAGCLPAAALRMAAHARRIAGARRLEQSRRAGAARLRESGNRRHCLNTLAFAALLLRPGEEVVLPRDSAARVFHAVEGSGEAQVNDTAIAFEHADTFCAPGLATVRLANRSSRAPLYLVSADESPLQRKLGVYEQR